MPALAVFHIRPHASGRLFAKVAVFASAHDLRRFCRARFGERLHPWTTGAVYRTGTEGEFGPRCFCFVGLRRGKLSAEMIVHEAVHAAHAYADRVTRNTFGVGCDSREERIAYATGRLAEQVAWNLKRLGM